MSILEIVKKPRNSEKIRAEIQDLIAEREAAEQRLRDLESSRKNVLLQDDDTKAEAHDADMAKQRRAIERCNLRIAPLESELVQATDRETQKARRAKYDDAQKLASDTAKFMRSEHEKIRLRILDFNETIAKAELAIEAANAELPEGAERLLGVEERLRSIPRRPREIVASEEFEAWTDSSGQLSWRPLLPADQKRVTPDPHRPGFFLYVSEAGQTRSCVKRKYRRTRYRPEVAGYFPNSILGRLTWPDLFTSRDSDGSFNQVWVGVDNAGVVGRVSFERARVIEPEQEQLPAISEELTVVDE